MPLWPLALLLLAVSVSADCPPGSKYDSSFNKCYQFFPTPATFLAAEQQCNSIGGHLADVQNAFENYYVAGQSEASSFWIGANLLISSNWAWTSPSPMSFTNWATGQPVNSTPCAFVKDSDHTWATRTCNSLLPYICTISPNATQPGFCPTPSPSTTPPPCSSDRVCTGNYTLYEGNSMCYKYHSESVTFEQANTTCSQEGGMLAKILSQDVNDFLAALPGFKCGASSCPFIGLSCRDDNENNCVWVDGTPLGQYRNFYVPTISANYALVTDITPGNPQDGKWETQAISAAFLCQKASEKRSFSLYTGKKEEIITTSASTKKRWQQTDIVH